MNMILLGADAVSLYPKLRKDQSAKIVASEFLKSDLEVTGTDWKEISRYVKMNSTRRQQIDWNVTQYLPVRAKSSGVEPGMSSMSGTVPDHGRCTEEQQWIYPDNPGKLGTKLLLAAALQIVINVLFETHTYQFGGHSFIQLDGGPIGLRVTTILHVSV